MSEEKYCFIHKNQPTRLSCSSCEKPICPKCMKNSSVGYKCPDCAKVSNHLNSISSNQFLFAILSGLTAGIFSGFIWNMLKVYGFFVNLLVAYAVGFCISKTITKIIGYKINPELKFTVSTITLVCMVYNPIILITNSISIPFVALISSLTLFNFMNLINILAIIIGIWAAVRHLEF